MNKTQKHAKIKNQLSSTIFNYTTSHKENQPQNHRTEVSLMENSPKKKRLDQVRDAIRLKHKITRLPIIFGDRENAKV
ncbi:hypothetical protein HYR99_04270 [Candidatus Poribacteria bacterium]|nr:hypothetical protein [Candidatus Poribacteria bacterium]